MWHFKNEETGYEVHGNRQEIVDGLNIHTLDFVDGDEEYEEWVDVSRESHWKRIVEEYNLTGDDD